MAYYHARSGACRSDAALSGLVERPFDVRYVPAGDPPAEGPIFKPVRSTPFRIERNLDSGPSRCSFSVYDTKPTMWTDVHVRRGPASSDLYWAGTVTDIKARIVDHEHVFWDVQAVDWTWLLDRYSYVNASYQNQSINVIAADIIGRFTNGGFRPGAWPSSLGTIESVRFENRLVSEALLQLAKAANGFLRIRADKTIDGCVTFPDGNDLEVDDDSAIRFGDYDEAGSGIATRVRMIGGGSTTTSVVSSSSTTIPVEDCSIFASGGGQVFANDMDVTYTGKSVATGPGSLTGCSGLTRGIEQGAQVRVLAVKNDTSAQSVLALALGSSRSGIAVATLSDDTLTDAEANLRAEAYLAFNSAVIPGLTFETEAEHYAVGKMITVAMTTPLVISGEFRVQSIETTYDDDVDTEQVAPRLLHRITARLGRRLDILDVLGRQS